MPERHQKLAQALALIQYLAASRAGRTLREIAEEMGCGRRTAERLLAAVREVCQDLEEVPTTEREKRWRVGPSSLTRVAAIRSEEVLEIEAAARRLAEEGLVERATILRRTVHKLRAMMDTAALRRAEPDVEALLAAEGLAARPGPRVELPEGLIDTLRHALLTSHRIALRYQGNDSVRDHVLEPYGLLYGRRPYLLAVKPGKPDAAVWRLDRMEAVSVTNEAFTPRPDFNLQSLAGQCFGVWREPPLDIVLRFDARVATEAAKWQFHASQKQSVQPDGSLIVRLSAGGLEEIAAHLASWGDTVEVLQPDRLRQRMITLGHDLLRKHGVTVAAVEGT